MIKEPKVSVEKKAARTESFCGEEGCQKACRKT